MGAQRRTLQKVHGKTTHVYHPEEEEDLTCQGSIGSAFLYTLAIYFTSLEPARKRASKERNFFLLSLSVQPLLSLRLLCRPL